MSESVRSQAGRADQDAVTGRFLPRNKAALKHGLRALSGDALGPRRHQVGWLLRGLRNELKAGGRTLSARNVARASRWCELQVVADKAGRELEARDWPVKTEGSERLFEVYRQAIGDQGKIAAELRISPTRCPRPGA
jgi:hypothetical protein